MTLLAVERIKLFTTRSPWWCALLTLLITIGFAALIAGTTDSGVGTVASTQFGYSFGLAVIMVLAALAVTTEYRFGTIRTTFQAVPNRTSVLLAKAGVVGLLALVIGEIAAFGSLGISMIIQPEADMALNSTAEWINVVGIGPIYALTAIIGMSVGLLIRHSAGAISLLLIYTLAVESLVGLIPNVGADIQKWMPFHVAEKFLTGDGATRSGMGGPPLSTSPLSPGWALAYFAGFALLMLVIGIGTARKRDA
ncbi:ABC transporter permease [Amycolatopsis cihanbeyliensis]|uniref:ABC-2 type transport system permease protein n=1 Tax=Amycolatopsis cihanbeyliensis TaxID=1128664 RepID=A0A542DL67_AMYCI|nr:ABC transporter permease [Amycolatopsis cihanbeyliensis]TQJ03774.1 ABC-2 type transport system permease protein [Amycolatopsis cihanbeyliensis]